MALLDERRHRAPMTLGALSLLLVVARPSPALADLRLTPDSVRIGAFFDGEWVRVSGEIPRGSQAIVEVVGKRIEEQLLRKGRHWDIWMNVGEIDIEHAPCLYFGLTTDPSEFTRAGADAEFGYTALQKRACFAGDVARWSHDEIFSKFVKLKEREKLYGLFPGALRVAYSEGDRSRIEGKFRIPSRVAPGTYQVRLSVVNHGRILDSESAELRIRIGGMPAFLASMAHAHGALYGVLAVAIALVFGFLVGFVFKGRRRRR